VASPGNDASEVLAITGAALKSVTLFFENKKIHDISLTNGLQFAEKYKDGQAIIVFDSTRSIDGWRDVFLEKEIANLVNGGTKTAEGLFFTVEYAMAVRISAADRCDG
jgi:hypothetical protein